MLKPLVFGRDGLKYDTCTVKCAWVKIESFGNCPKKGSYNCQAQSYSIPNKYKYQLIALR